VAGATDCKNRLTLRTCKDGVWTESPCGTLQICSPGAPAACIAACNGLVSPSNAVTMCSMPFDPSAAYLDPASTYNDVPITTISVTSDPVGLPRSGNFGATLDSNDLSGGGSGDTPAPVVAESSIGLAWRTPAPTRWFGRIFIYGYFELQNFVKKFGSRPSGVSLYMKSRKFSTSGALSPIPSFILWSSVDTDTGDYAAVTELEDDTASLGPGNDWKVTRRDFTKDEIAALSIDDKVNRWEVDFASSIGLPFATQPPENVEIAWFALVLTPPL
jgi:hypothetical protein